MVILGLGSNVGDRLDNFRKALQALENLSGLTIQQISPVYCSDALLPDNAPPEWDMPHLNLALRCQTTLSAQDLLTALKNIEWRIGRKPERRHWGPRILDIDILAWDQNIIHNESLTIPHANLQERPFALWPLADVAPSWIFPLSGENQGKCAEEIAEKWGSRFTGAAPFRTRQLLQRIDTAQLVGILNITPDSFSQDGLYPASPETVLKQAIQQVEDGAEILDIGAESTAPSAKKISPQEEWQRLEPVLSAIKTKRADFIIQPKISVDTYHAETAERALEYDIDWINDVSGLTGSKMRALVAQNNTSCIIMHHVTIPAHSDHFISRIDDSVKTVYDWFEARLNELEKQGIERHKLILDPGIGFGKKAEQSLALIQHIKIFKKLGLKILVGHSRKSFFSLLTGLPAKDRNVETMTASLFLEAQKVDYLRLHQVAETARAFKVMKALHT